MKENITAMSGDITYSVSYHADQNITIVDKTCIAILGLNNLKNLRLILLFPEFPIIYCSLITGNRAV